jgi:hypothetical protein
MSIRKPPVCFLSQHASLVRGCGPRSQKSKSLKLKKGAGIAGALLSLSLSEEGSIYIYGIPPGYLKSSISFEISEKARGHRVAIDGIRSHL